MPGVEGTRVRLANVILALWSVLIVAAGCCGNGRTLSVVPHPQETDHWCWAASGEMVMHYLGRDVSQCTQVNDSLNRTNCPCTQCSNAVANPSCLEYGWPNFGRYGFSFQRTSYAALTWTQLKAEIDAGRPVAFTWQYAGGGGHIMVAIGYREIDGTRSVVVFNPLPVCQGDHEIITYEAYQSDANYSHWDDFYNIHPTPSSQ